MKILSFIVIMLYCIPILHAQNGAVIEGVNENYGGNAAINVKTYSGDTVIYYYDDYEDKTYPRALSASSIGVRGYGHHTIKYRDWTDGEEFIYHGIGGIGGFFQGSQYGLVAVGSDNNGIYASSTKSTGIYGKSKSAYYGGIYGIVEHQSPSSSAYGVRGEVNSYNGSEGDGVFGLHTGSGIGVRGLVQRDGGIGVSGTARGIDGMGVYGLHYSSSGDHPGVRGETKSTSTYAKGVEGKININSGSLSAAIRGQHKGTNGKGYGIWGTHSGTGVGVYGSTGLGGIGVLGEIGATGNAFSVGVKGVGGGVGVQGNGQSFDFLAVGPGTNYGTGSSSRWKNNIKTIPESLDLIKQLRGVYFDWDEDHGGKKDIGFIAEEVGEVLPLLVEYEENGIDAIGLDYSKMTPLLINAINEQQEIIKSLLSRIEQIENNKSSQQYALKNE